MIKYIFCITTGRSGTDYVSRLFGALEDTASFHEQKPRMHKRMMREYLTGNKKAVQQKMKKKYEIIERSRKNIYVDTTHVFIKSFGWELPKYIPQENIGVIILKRDIQKIMKSTHRTQSGPLNELGRDWIIGPHKNAVTKPPVNRYLYEFYRLILRVYWKITKQKGPKHYPDFFRRQSLKLIEWYYQETYALGEKFQQKFPDITYVEADLESLNDYEGFEVLINKFRLQKLYKKERLKNIIGTPVNLKTNS